jgi:putative ATP-dependent endonuclease of the OLD family
MGILIEKVRIKNFRSLKNIEVTLSNLTLLVGANNAGKTSFLRAINLALGVEKRGVTLDDLFIDKQGEGLTDKTITIDILISPTNNNKEKTESFDSNWVNQFKRDINSIGNQEFLAFRFQYVFDGNSEDSARPNWYVINNWESPNINEEADLLTAKIDNIRLYFIDAQRDIQDDLRNRTSYFGKLATQIEYSPTEKSQLEDSLAGLNNEAVENSEVLKHLKLSLIQLNETVKSGGKGVEITPLPKKIRDLHKGMKIHFQDSESETFGLEYHGLGTRSWASLLAFKAYVSWEENEKNPNRRTPYYPILALEEPESHLHPNAQRHLYQQLSSINGQKIISTHSPYIVGQAALDEIRFFNKVNDETTINSLDISTFSNDEIRKIKREIIHSKGELLFSKAVILSEGETEEQALPIFASRYWEKEPFELGVNFVGCGGSNYKAFLKVFDAFKINWFIFSDYDNESIKESVHDAIQVVNISKEDISNHPEIVLTGQGLEKYLFENGCSDEICDSIIIHHEPFENETHKNAKTNEIRKWNDTKINDYLKKWKTKLSPIYSQIIADLPDDRCMPPKIKELFEEISKRLNLSSPFLINEPDGKAE